VTSEKQPQIAGCDSQVLMWALPWAMSPSKKRKKTPQDVVEMRRRARILLQLFSEQEIELCVPSVVVSELLAGRRAIQAQSSARGIRAELLLPPV
jgi:hypothetical protein